MKIPRSHPRYGSLVTRETLVAAWKAGIVVPEGLIAHGRGEAFDYLLGEETSAPALVAEKAAAAFLMRAASPEIGRASCRERVEIVGVGVILKKKMKAMNMIMRHTDASQHR